MQHDIPKLDSKGLREFGLIMSVIIGGLFGCLFPWLLDKQWPLWPWIISATLASWALLIPLSLNPIYYSWMRIGLILGAISSRIILSVLFYLVFTPIGFLMRLRGYDPMKRHFDKQAISYRITSQPRPKKHMERPF